MKLHIYILSISLSLSVAITTANTPTLQSLHRLHQNPEFGRMLHSLSKDHKKEGIRMPTFLMDQTVDTGLNLYKPRDIHKCMFNHIAEAEAAFRGKGVLGFAHTMKNLQEDYDNLHRQLIVIGLFGSTVMKNKELCTELEPKKASPFIIDLIKQETQENESLMDLFTSTVIKNIARKIAKLGRQEKYIHGLFFRMLVNSKEAYMGIVNNLFEIGTALKTLRNGTVVAIGFNIKGHKDNPHKFTSTQELDVVTDKTVIECKVSTHKKTAALAKKVAHQHKRIIADIHELTVSPDESKKMLAGKEVILWMAHKDSRPGSPQEQKLADLYDILIYHDEEDTLYVPKKCDTKDN